MSRFILVANLLALASAGYTEWFFSSNITCPGQRTECPAPTDMCQVNVCVATQDNPIAAVSEALMNETFSSLSSASPSASTFSVDAISLAARATAASTSSSQSSPATEAATSTPANDPTLSDTGESDGSDSVSPGTIAGAVVGGVAGLAIIGALIWFLQRRRTSKQHYEHPSSPDAAEAGKQDQSGAKSPNDSTPAIQYHIAEMEGTREIEMSDRGLKSSQEIKELPSGQDTVRELPA